MADTRTKGEIEAYQDDDERADGRCGLQSPRVSYGILINAYSGLTKIGRAHV